MSLGLLSVARPCPWGRGGGGGWLVGPFPRRFPASMGGPGWVGGREGFPPEGSSTAGRVAVACVLYLFFLFLLSGGGGRGWMEVFVCASPAPGAAFCLSGWLSPGCRPCVLAGLALAGPGRGGRGGGGGGAWFLSSLALVLALEPLWGGEGGVVAVGGPCACGASPGGWAPPWVAGFNHPGWLWWCRSTPC